MCWLYCLKKKKESFVVYLLLLELGSATWVCGATRSPSTGADRTSGWPWPVPAGQSVLCAWVKVWVHGAALCCKAFPSNGTGRGCLLGGQNSSLCMWNQVKTEGNIKPCPSVAQGNVSTSLLAPSWKERRLQCASGQIVWQKIVFGRRIWSETSREGPDHTHRSGASWLRDKLARVRNVRAPIQSTLQRDSPRPRRPSCPSWAQSSWAGFQDLIYEAVHLNSPSDASVHSLEMILCSLNTGSKLNERVRSRF